MDSESRATLGRILFAVVWMPIQITLSLIFAAGGIMLVLILGLALGPFIGLFFLLRHLLRQGRSGPGDVEPTSTEHEVSELDRP